MGRRQKYVDEIPAIKRALQAQLSGVLSALGLHGRVSGGVMYPRNPRRADRKPGSFVVWLRGEAAGSFGLYSFQLPGKGDVLDLIAYVHGSDRKFAIKWARDFLGWREGRAPKRFRAAKPARQDAVSPPREDNPQELAEMRRRAKAWWLQGRRLPGTVAETYLRWRGIRLEKLRRLPGSLRCHARLAHKPTGTEWPCMMAAMLLPDGTFAGVHRTYLAADGRGKAPVQPVKMMWPRGLAGAFIPLARGMGDWPLREAAKRGAAAPLCLTEGIEDGLTIAAAMPHWRVWAVGSVGNFAHVAPPREAVSELIIAADRDTDNPTAQRALREAVRAQARRGLPVRLLLPPEGCKDFNELLQGAAAQMQEAG